MTQAKIPYTCLLGDEATIRKIPNFSGFPTSLIVDRAGKVRLLVTQNEQTTPKLLADAVEILLDEPAPPGVRSCEEKSELSRLRLGHGRICSIGGPPPGRRDLKSPGWWAEANT